MTYVYNNEYSDRYIAVPVREYIPRCPETEGQWVINMMNSGAL